MTKVRKRILVLENGYETAELLKRSLADQGYTIDWVSNGEDGLVRMDKRFYDLVILELMLPGIDGFETCRRLRVRANYTPIIMVSTKALEIHRIVGLEMGADDYVSKPYSIQELLARIKALLRRVEALTQNIAYQNDSAITAGYLRIEPLSREVWVNGKQALLTAKEFDLLYFFAKHPGQIFTRLQLLKQVWGYTHKGYEHTVNSHINRLRAKVELDPIRPKQIKTVWGVGYKFSCQNELEAA